MRARSRLGALITACAVLIGCATQEPDTRATAVPGETLIGPTWEWVETTTPDGRIAAPRPHRYTVRLKDNGEAQLRFDCNHGGSYYRIADGSLSFGPLTATRIPCPEGSRGAVFMEQIDAVEGFFTEQGLLYLELPDNTGTMRFRRADSQ